VQVLNKNTEEHREKWCTHIGHMEGYRITKIIIIIIIKLKKPIAEAKWHGGNKYGWYYGSLTGLID
jgi:hypothetical protein